MKRLLLFSLAMTVAGWSFGQYANSFRKANTAEPKVTVADDGSFTQAGPVNHRKSDAAKGPLQAVSISSSGNVYGYLVENSSALTYNGDIDVFMFTHRADPNVIGNSTGDIIVSQSRDGGATWSQMMAFPNATGYYNRYPGGQLYNPTGNTSPDSAFAVVMGPSHDGVSSNVWQHGFLGSMQLDSTDIDHQYFPTYGAIVRYGFTNVGNKFYTIASNYDNVTTGVLDSIRFYTGTWVDSTKSVDWNVDLFTHSYLKDADGTDFGYYWYWNTAWSPDGNTGYYWTVGRDSSNDTRAYMPIVWKSTDAGATWTKMPVYDFSNITTITDELRPMNGSTSKRPQFNSSLDGTVDVNGNLHLMCEIHSAFSDNNDSLGYYFTWTITDDHPALHNTVFDVFTTSSGWDAVKMGYTYTLAPADADVTYGMGWDLRLQAGRTADGSKVFASWSDTDTSFASSNSSGLINSFPDLYVAGYDVVSGKQTPATNFTAGTSVAGDCFFHYFSDIIPANNGTYSLPLTELDLGTSDTDPVTINFLKGLEFTDADFVANVGMVKKAQTLATVAQNRPNPFSGSTNIDVTMNQAANLSLMVTSITGQKVYERNYGKVSAGMHRLQFNGSSLSPGVYFYTVQAGNSQITNKMIIK